MPNSKQHDRSIPLNEASPSSLCVPGDGARAIDQLERLLARGENERSSERIASVFDWLRRRRRMSHG